VRAKSFSISQEKLFDALLDDNQRQNDGEIANQEWKSANESEKGKRRFVLRPREKNEQS
jgi:hypothetical protein